MCHLYIRSLRLPVKNSANKLCAELVILSSCGGGYLLAGFFAGLVSIMNIFKTDLSFLKKVKVSSVSN